MLLAVAAVLIAAFVAIELRSRNPLVPFGIFRLRTLTGANVVGLLVGASLFSMFFFISLYMQQVLGWSAIKSGLSYLPLAGSIILSAGVASQLVTRIGFKQVMAIGTALIAVALVWFAQVSPHGGFVADVLGPSVIAAVGLGFAFVTTTIAAVAGVEDRDSGLASGLINTTQQVGGALGLAVLSAISISVTGTSHAPDVLTRGFHDAFLAGAGIAVLALVATLTLIRSSDSRAHVDLGAAPVAGESPA